MTDLLKTAILQLMTLECYDQYFVNLNFFHGECMKSTLSKVLGTGIVLASMAVKIPQILKIIQNKSGEGISLVGVSLEIISITSFFLYSYVKNFPFSAWGDGPSIGMQTVAILALILYYRRETSQMMLFLSTYFAVVFLVVAGIIPFEVSVMALWYLQVLNLPIAIAGKVSAAVGETLMMPVYTILLFIAFSMIGLLSLPWTMAAEVFPTEIRGIAHGIVVASAHTILFISLQSYYSMAEFFGGHDGLQWFFAGMCLLAFVFIYFFLPETHKKTLFEIEDYFENHTIYVKQKSGKSKTKPGSKERKFSIKTLGKMEALPENHSEYDTLVKEGQNNSSKTAKVDSNLIGGTDVRDFDFIDKSFVDLDKIPDP